jgi:adenine-specific DNA-methyltransferase
MKLIIKTPKQSLNKAFLKQRPLRSEIDLFKDNLTRLLGKIDEIEREENQKNLIRDFLLNTYYKDSNEINTKDDKDLVIHNGKTRRDTVGVIIEAKRPSNRNEMVSAEMPNTKAFQELVLYYLRERVEDKNNDIKYLVASNIYEWYIFEASYFEKAFFRNKSFVKRYEDWRDGKKVTKDTILFYNEIAKPFINDLEEEFPCTHFDIRTYEAALKNADKEDDKKLIQLFKILSPNHLLKVPFADDSNTLDEKFYKELLHIIGLEETKEGSKFIIRRKLEDRRNAGSLLEMAISILETEDPLHKVTGIQNYGESKGERTYNVALELCITWINRILFLKLLEGQLVNYHKGDKAYRFLNSGMVKDFDELYKLFHQVLAKTTGERSKIIKEKYSRVPYLNSSLFEISDLEDQTLKINQLDNSAQLELINTSILKQDKTKHETLPSLEYIFRFLDAYDFASEGKEDIQENSKKLINASVLGKVFEKINGYKDGSIFTPGFITMYICRQSIRLAVLQKFKEKYDWKINNFDDLKNYLADRKSSKDILINNRLINSLHICDPAVGSGHFLVSSLNELIAIKSELGLLADDKGIRISSYEVTIENDELIISDEEGEIFEYQWPLLKKGKSGEAMQRLQRTLFHEKQTIIENCLFGVDINPNSVKICRLRLWIELLKNAYYKEPDFTELETLPNIDINIKCGNTLLSRFPLEIDLSDAFKKQQFNLDTYKTAVEAYRKTSDKNAKTELTALIKKIKDEYTATIYKRDPRRKKLADIRGQIVLIQNNVDLFGTKKLSDKDKIAEERKLTLLLSQKEMELKEAEQGTMYRNAFEWRFEFPEVLDSTGKYIGFDLVVGNPPYIRVQELDKSQVAFFNQAYLSAHKNYDIYILFVEKGLSLIRNNGKVGYIMPTKFIKTAYGEKLKNLLYKETLLEEFIDFGENQVFDGATTYVGLFLFSKVKRTKFVYSKVDDFDKLVTASRNTLPYKLIENDIWVLKSPNEASLFNRLSELPKLSDYAESVFVGLQTSADPVYILELCEDGSLYSKFTGKHYHFTSDIIKPLLKGAEIKRFSKPQAQFKLIFPYKNVNSKMELITRDEMIRNYEDVWDYLLSCQDKLKNRENGKMNNSEWWGFVYPKNLEEFDKPKLLTQVLAVHSSLTYDKNGSYYFVGGGTAGGYGISLIDKSDENYHFILGLMNSKLLEWYIHTFASPFRGGYYAYSRATMEEAPIMMDNKKDIAKAVLEILCQKEAGKDTLGLEADLDKRVYELYNLLPAEIKIIEAI